jgi:hypothetical protein
MQTSDTRTQIVDIQPKVDLPMMKPIEMQYFDRFLVDIGMNFDLDLAWRGQYKGYSIYRFTWEGAA